MKKLLIGLFLMTSVNCSLYANGEISSQVLKDTTEAVTEAIIVFEANNAPDIINDYKGLKVSPNGHAMQVKFYTVSRGIFSYGCHRHEADEPFECHESK